MNANVCKNKDGELVYITNKANVEFRLGVPKDLAEKIGFSFEEEFKKYLAPYVKPEHVYFVRGKNDFIVNELLFDYQGGIHCMCSEIPEEDVND